MDAIFRRRVTKQPRRVNTILAALTWHAFTPFNWKREKMVKLNQPCWSTWDPWMRASVHLQMHTQIPQTGSVHLILQTWHNHRLLNFAEIAEPFTCPTFDLYIHLWLWPSTESKEKGNGKWSPITCFSIWPWHLTYDLDLQFQILFIDMIWSLSSCSFKSLF